MRGGVLNIEIGETLVRFGETRTVEGVDSDGGVWFRQKNGKRGYAPLLAWLQWIVGRR